MTDKQLNASIVFGVCLLLMYSYGEFYFYILQRIAGDCK